MPKVADRQRPRPQKRPVAAPTTAHQPTLGAAAPKKGNGWAVAGFILAFLFAPLGLIFSVVGLKKAKQLGGVGRGLGQLG